MLGDGYLKLEAAAEPDGRGEDCRLELILVDEGRKSKSENLEKVPKDVAIRAEARVIAERLRQLFDGAAGEPYRPGDTALLLRTATHAEEYRDALAGCGIDSYLSIGSRYFDKLELADIIAFLKLVVNPLDDIAMLAVLRSPFVGLSDDELFLLRLAAGPGGRGEALWPFISRLPGAASSAGGWASPEAGELDQALHSRLVFFREGLDRLRRSAGREPLEVLIRRLIDHNDYAAVLASAADGRQRLANLDLLMDLAADFEEVWGRDVAGLARFLQQQQERKPRQAEAPIEEEGVDAVRIMTMHAAKGLQFPLVVLPDLGNTGNSRNDSIIRLDRRQLGRIGLKYRDSSSAGEKVFQFEELEEEDLERERREEKRLGYVAMTRARSHLIMSGIAPVDRGPGSKKKRSPALDWLRDILHLKRERTGEDITEFLDVNGVPVRFHVCARIRQLARRYGEDVVRRKSAAVEPLDPDLGRVPPAASFVPPVISASALDTLASCPRRYYFQHVCRADRLMARQRQPAAGGEQPGEGLQPWEKGTLVHAILERAPDLGRIDPERATGDDLDALAGELLEPGWSIGPGDRDDISRLLGNLGASPSVARLREAAEKGDLAREFPFRTLLGDTTILNGAIDALALLDGSVLVVDYKTGGAGEDGVEEAASHYRMQMTAYALAASRLYPGRAVDVALVFLEQPGLEATVSYREEETGSLQRRLEKLIDSLSDASFPPLDAYDEYHCTWCPGAHRLPPG
jgi:ATP-dependent exoDNAse (exonuclease V) beta subunit